MYDGVLKIQKSKQAEILGYADDLAVVVVCKTMQEVAQVAEDTISRIKRWMYAAGLELADQKTELLLISSRKKVESLQIRVGGHLVNLSESIKYLGVMLDRRLSFKHHINYASSKAAKTCMALLRLTPNARGPKSSTRSLLTSVCSSTLTYAAQVWGAASIYPSYMKEAMRVYRLYNLRIICAYRTVSDDAAGVLAGRVPIDIQLRKLNRLYENSKGNGDADSSVPVLVILLTWKNGSKDGTTA